MSIKEKINNIIKYYRRGIFDYEEAKVAVSQIMDCNAAVAEIIIDNGLYK